MRYLAIVILVAFQQTDALGQFELSRQLSTYDSPVQEILASSSSAPPNDRPTKGTSTSASREWVRAWNANNRSLLMQLTASEQILDWAIGDLVKETRSLPEIRQSQAYKRKISVAGDLVVMQLKQIYDPLRHGNVIAGESIRVDENAVAYDLYLESDPDGPFGILIVQRINGRWLITDLRVDSECLSLVQLVQYEIIASLPRHPEVAAWMPGREAQSAEIRKLRRLRDAREWGDFEREWNDLDEQTKNWPLAQFLRIAILQEYDPAEATEARIERFAKTGFNPNSVAWLRRRQNLEKKQKVQEAFRQPGR